MSIVERAIRKLQSQSGAAAPVARTPVTERQSRVEPLQSHGAPVSSTRTADARVYAKTVRLEKDALRAAGFLAPEHQERLISSQYRQIKRPLIANAIGVNAVSNGHLIMVASAVPGEGKTFTAVNLALSIALEKDFSVLLVDADVPKPHISKVFGLAGQPGLLDALQDTSLDVESLIVGTNIERLAVLPAGRGSETATELIASARMQQIVASLADSDAGNRIVVFDSPPLLLTSESRVLAGIVGQVVLVVQAGVTPQQSVLNALSHVPEGISTGLVLNQSEVERGADYYYGYGAASQPEEARAGDFKRSG
jgi:exopolysaccharide/PEP-CTERM locus tyrosine autokinase